MNYHGLVLAASNAAITIDGESGYGGNCCVTIESSGVRFILYLNPKDASEFARHLNAAVELAERPVNTI